MAKGKPISPEPTQPVEPKETRAQARARRKAEHAEKIAAEKAAREALRSAPLETVLAQPDHIGDTTQMVEEPTRLASPPGSSHAHMAQAPAHAHAREGVVLDEAEFAGLVDEPVPPETPATARYMSVPHSSSPATEAAVMALRYAGQDDEEIALYLRVSMATLYRDYRVTLAEAHAQMSGKLAIRMATMGLSGDFKAAKFIAEKRLRGFGAADKPFTAVRQNADSIDPSLTTRNASGQSAAAFAIRERKAMPAPGPDGRIEFTMALGVAERPLRINEDG